MESIRRRFSRSMHPTKKSGVDVGEAAGECCPPPTNARKGRFRPKERHSKRNAAETFHPGNDLAENRSNPVM
jgi:hypothetical protein